MNEQKKIMYIGVEHIHPHPKNPRKQLGDLSELAASILMNGVLQNLTVVPAPELGEGEYTAIIGHRRHAAAKQAGLTELPCVVVEMDEAAQVRTMVCENVQRSDLTPYEQAEGFQMMLDLGGTIEEVSKLSGFSTQTIRNRTGLLKLDKDEFKKAEARGVSLFDFAAIAALDSADDRKRCLQAAGTKNFARELMVSQEKQEKAIVKAANFAFIESFAEKLEEGTSTSSFRRILTVAYGDKEKHDLPSDAKLLGGSVPYYFKDNGYYAFEVFRPLTEEERNQDTARTEKAAKERERIAYLEVKAAELRSRPRKLRTNFIASVSETKAKKALPEIMAMIWENLVDVNSYNGLRHTLSGVGDYVGADDEEIYFDAADTGRKYPAKSALYLAGAVTDPPFGKGYIKNRWDSDSKQYVWEYEPNDGLDDLYKILSALGYEMSDEELQLQNGNHPFFSEVPSNTGSIEGEAAPTNQEQSEPDVSNDNSEEMTPAEDDGDKNVHITQDDMDEVYRSYGTTRFAIYEQFQKGLSNTENAAFLKGCFGNGGNYPAISDKDLAEDHDSRGIRFRLGGLSSPIEDITVSWSKVAKRIRELCDAGRYLAENEIETYKAWLENPKQVFPDEYDDDEDDEKTEEPANGTTSCCEPCVPESEQDAELMENAANDPEDSIPAEMVEQIIEAGLVNGLANSDAESIIAASDRFLFDGDFGDFLRNEFGDACFGFDVGDLSMFLDSGVKGICIRESGVYEPVAVLNWTEAAQTVRSMIEDGRYGVGVADSTSDTDWSYGD
jgi:ParB family chromosome partitioning protein